MKQKLQLYLGLLVLSAIFLASCNEDEDTRGDLPTSVILHYSVDDTKVAFNALAVNADTYSWDFGDGNTSTEANPVHTYEVGGYYSVTLSVTGGTGTVSDEAYLAISLPPFELLTGDPATGNGKTWKMSAAHSSGGDYFANADAELSVVDDTPAPLPDGIFGTEFGMGGVYDDTYTFYPDGSYVHDVEADGGDFGGYVFQLLTDGGANVTNANGASFGLCIANYTPETGATFTFNENVDLTVPSVYGGVPYTGAMTIDFSGTEFIGFRDFQSMVILNSISDTKMQLTMFMAAGTDPEIVGVNTHALIMTFELAD
ncbi:MAG: PKD domain-containing protein [Cyclobacteriaceae bacterium]